MKDMSLKNIGLISSVSSIRDALNKLNLIPAGSTLFIFDTEESIVGTLTDGDIRRGLLNNLSIEDNVSMVMRTNFKYLELGSYYNDQIEDFRRLRIKTIPLLSSTKKLINVYDLSVYKSVLPIDSVIMAGGRGERLKPLTDNTPKPLLKIGDKPIIEHNIDRLISNGVENFHLSINYLGEQLIAYFNDGSDKKVKFNYINEKEPLGTIGSVSMIEEFEHENVLVMNSDLLTNIDFADFYKEFYVNNADIAIATIPYNVSIPYAVMETKGNNVLALKEKPTYTYYSNAGIYLIKRSFLKSIPYNSFYNATDLIEEAIKNSHKVISYPIRGYWLDIGKPDDFLRAQEDIKHINLD